MIQKFKDSCWDKLNTYFIYKNKSCTKSTVNTRKNFKDCIFTSGKNDILFGRMTLK